MNRRWRRYWRVQYDRAEWCKLNGGRAETEGANEGSLNGRRSYYEEGTIEGEANEPRTKADGVRGEASSGDRIDGGGGPLSMHARKEVERFSSMQQ